MKIKEYNRYMFDAVCDRIVNILLIDEITDRISLKINKILISLFLMNWICNEKLYPKFIKIFKHWRPILLSEKSKFKKNLLM